MKVLVIGAGASYAELKNLGIKEELRLPLMSNFARKTWKEFNPHPFLDKYLEEKGYSVLSEDGREMFYALEAENKVNVEEFFEFCWINREHSWDWSNNQEVKKIGFVADMKNADGTSQGILPKDFLKGIRMLSDTSTTLKFEMGEADFWDNLLREGIGRPFSESLMHCFHPNDVKQLTLTKKMISSLNYGDIVISLNYDTLFEIALSQANKLFAYSPNVLSNSVMVCKPHGSLNFSIKIIPNSGELQLTTGSPFWWGSPEMPQSHGGYSYLGLIPPRLNKTYEQNPISKEMLDSIKKLCPESVSFWGVGLTKSDLDLCEVFKNWDNAGNNLEVNVINPDSRVINKFQEIFQSKKLNHFVKAEDYVYEKYEIVDFNTIARYGSFFE